MQMRTTARLAVALTGAVLLMSAVLPGAMAQKKGKKGGTPSPGVAAEGIAVYQKSGCAACHSIGGKGGKTGPDLSHVGKTASAATIAKYVRNPKSVNKNAKMPAFAASKIGDKELKALSAYLGGLR